MAKIAHFLKKACVSFVVDESIEPWSSSTEVTAIMYHASRAPSSTNAGSQTTTAAAAVEA